MSGTFEQSLLPSLRERAYAGLDASRHLVQFEGNLDPRFDVVFAPMVATSAAGALRILNLNTGSGEAACHLGTMIRDRADGSHVVCLGNDLAEAEGWTKFTLNAKSLGLHRVLTPLAAAVLEGLRALQTHRAIFDLIFVGGIPHSLGLRRQLEQAWPLLAAGGLLCGGEFAPANVQVVDAIQAFVRDYGLNGSTDHTLWFMPKPAAAASAA